MQTHIIRQAVPADRLALTSMLDIAFRKVSPTGWFADFYPHLFTDARIAEHTLAVEGNRIIGCVGCYRFQAVLHGKKITAAGIGQVATMAEARGHGIMKELLARALDHQKDVDFFWLYGDRQRYGHVGFGPGGRVFQAMTWKRYAPPPGPGPKIRPLDMELDTELLETALAAQPFVLRQDQIERRWMLHGKDLEGWTDGTACIVLGGNGRRVILATGNHDAVTRLVCHKVNLLAAANPGETGVTIVCDMKDPLLLAVGRRLGDSFSITSAAMMRAGRLAPLLSAWAATRKPLPGASLRRTVLDGGDAGRVSISAAGPGFRIEPTTDTPDVVLTGSALAELLFGMLPAAACLPGIPGDSALLHLLPVSFSIPECYAL